MRSPASVEHEFPAPYRELIRQAKWLVCIGAPHLALLNSLADREHPMLLVLPSREKEQGLLERSGREGWPEHWEPQAQLVGAQDGESTWFRYSDPRCDGVIPADQLLLNYPNLKLEGIELRQQISLNTLLETWKPASNDGGVLLLAPESSDLLGSLNTTLAMRLVGVVQQGFRVKPDPDPDLVGRLGLASLVPLAGGASEGACVWRRDPMVYLERTLLAERDQLKDESDGLERRVLDLERQLAAINSEIDSILSLLDN